MRIGIGYDVHRLADGRKLILGGIEIPYEKGLLGHSDADVLVHAVIDAVIGAMGQGDIGSHFPDNDEKFKNIDSTILLRAAMKMLGKYKYRLVNVDSTIIAQEPKLAPYINEMRQSMSVILGIPFSDVNIKAKTEEGLGFTGRGEGIAAQAVCLIEEKEMKQL